MLAGGSQRTAWRRAYSLLPQLRSGVLVYEGVLTWDGEQDGTLVEMWTVFALTHCFPPAYLVVSNIGTWATLVPLVGSERPNA